LIERYVRAWEATDLDGFVSLLKEDAAYAMPPWRHWYRGRDSIRTFFAYVWRFYSDFRLVAVGANGQPAFALYCRKPGDPAYRAHGIQVLEIQDDAISALTEFQRPLGPELFAEFELPLTRTDDQR
jgi:RNA polymerase sigma-70 factor (ECF subfamily)